MSGVMAREMVAHRVDVETWKRVKRLALETGRTVEDVAEAMLKAGLGRVGPRWRCPVLTGAKGSCRATRRGR